MLCVVLETPFPGGPTTGVIRSTGVCLWRESVSRVASQRSKMQSCKLSRCVAWIRMKAEFRDSHGPTSEY